MVRSTLTDPSADSWRIRDPADRFRLWADIVFYPFPAVLSHQYRWIIGSAEDAWLRVQDGCVSRQHAELLYDAEGWKLIDLNSKNGICLNGEKLPRFAVTPGAEIRIGRVSLIAESKLLRGLQEVLCRLIGWSPDRRTDVDVALRSIRTATSRHEPLVLCADAGHVSIARLLHEHVIGPNRPFVLCDRRGMAAGGPGEQRSTRAIAYANGMAAFAAASGGTLVVRRNRLPDDFEEVLAAVRAGGERVFLIVCAPIPPRSAQLHLHLVVPSLAGRTAELGRIVDAYVGDVTAEIGGSFTAEDRAWVMEQPKLTFATIETAARRVLAHRASHGGINLTANRVGRSHGAVSVWFARRADLPALPYMDDEDDDGDDE
jgi:hypothetical protein